MDQEESKAFVSTYVAAQVLQGVILAPFFSVLVCVLVPEKHADYPDLPKLVPNFVYPCIVSDLFFTTVIACSIYTYQARNNSRQEHHPCTHYRSKTYVSAGPAASPESPH